MALQSFGTGISAVVFGASGGIGAAFVAALRDHPALVRLHTVSRNGNTDHNCDYRDERSIADVAKAIAADGPVHLVIVATGVLHSDEIAPEKTWKALDPAVMAEVFAVNTIAPTLIAKHMLPLLAKDRKTAFAALSARVGSVSDNRLGGWLSYRSSKAALNMAIKTLSIELRRVNQDAIIVGLHPGTVETELSRPFRGRVPKAQLFSSRDSTKKMLATLDFVSEQHSGKLLSYDGDEILP